MVSTSKNITVTATEAGQRLDLFCVVQLPTLSRSTIQKAIKAGNITVNGDVVKPKYLVQANDNVSIAIAEEAVPETEVESLPIPILYEDEDVVVINKPTGIAVHPGVGKERSTVVSWFVNRYPLSKSVGDDPLRPGIVHRLDKDTSGVLVLAKTQRAFDHLKQQFKKRYVKKEYLALVFGVPGGQDGRINRALARSRRNPLRRTVDPEGKPAITEWQIEQAFNKSYALLRLWPLTGRMHQLRVHLHFLGYPIVGDKLYTFRRQRPPQGVVRQLLHAEKITFTLPSGQVRHVEAPLPEDLQATIDQLSK